MTLIASDGARAHPGDLDIRVVQQEPEHLPASVSGASYDSYSHQRLT